MTAADEYQRVAARVMCKAIHPTYLLGPCSTCRRATQALAADPGVRAAVEREARAEELERAADEVLHEFDPPIEACIWASEWLRNRAAAYRQEPGDGE